MWVRFLCFVGNVGKKRKSPGIAVVFNDSDITYSEAFMNEEKEITRNERVCKLADAVAALGYEIKEIKFLVDDNEQDEKTASQTGMPYVKLILSI